MSQINESPRFKTQRLKFWREQDLSGNSLSTVDHIEKFGCSVLYIEGDSSSRFSYTVGVFDTSGSPELITVGLIEKTAHIALNAAVKLLRSGIDLTQGRYREIVGEVECRFAPVDPKWLHHVMGLADWYYTGEDVPVLQLIYPDHENRFQDEEGFTEYFRQPMLGPGVTEGRRELDFWAVKRSQIAACPDGSFPILRIRPCFSRKQFSRNKNRLPMSPTMQRMTLGSF